MRLLRDTHVLLWAALEPARISVSGRDRLNDPGHDLLFSPASLLEIAIKRGLGRLDFTVQPRPLRRALLDNGYTELPITRQHAVAVEDLPAIHKDPFGRLLVAQAIVEGVFLVSADPVLARYPAPVRAI